MSWRILTSRIIHDGTGHLAVTICRHRPHFRGVVYLAGLALPGGSTEHEVHCPACTAGRGLTVSGDCGGPAQMACPDGHEWTPRLPGLSPEQVLREASTRPWEVPRRRTERRAPSPTPRC